VGANYKKYISSPLQKKSSQLMLLREIITVYEFGYVKAGGTCRTTEL
jgi:hypothetical protein